MYFRFYRLHSLSLSVCSEGSVIAYYESEFSVPMGQEGAVDQAMSSLSEKYNNKLLGRFASPGTLQFDTVVASGVLYIPTSTTRMDVWNRDVQQLFASRIKVFVYIIYVHINCVIIKTYTYTQIYRNIYIYL